MVICNGPSFPFNDLFIIFFDLFLTPNLCIRSKLAIIKLGLDFLGVLADLQGFCSSCEYWQQGGNVVPEQQMESVDAHIPVTVHWSTMAEGAGSLTGAQRFVRIHCNGLLLTEKRSHRSPFQESRRWPMSIVQATYKRTMRLNSAILLLLLRFVSGSDLGSQSCSICWYLWKMGLPKSCSSYQ